MHEIFKLLAHITQTFYRAPRFNGMQIEAKQSKAAVANRLSNQCHLTSKADDTNVYSS